MHISKISLSSFKSFKQPSKITNPSKNINIIVGKNGSGKSNLITAISTFFTPNRILTEEKQNLLNEGNVLTQKEAKINVTISNNDRFPFSDSFTLSRVFDLKKDEYEYKDFYANSTIEHETDCDIDDKENDMVDKKNHNHDTADKKQKVNTTKSCIQRDEMKGLFESVNLLQKFFIVQQGKINHLSYLDDYERYELIKEIAGAQVYERDRTQSIELLQESKTNEENICNMLKSVNERIKSLCKERERYKEYEKLENEKRVYENVLYRIEKNDIEKELEELESIEESESDIEDIKDEVYELEKMILEKEKEIQSMDVEYCANQNPYVVDKIGFMNSLTDYNSYCSDFIEIDTATSNHAYVNNEDNNACGDMRNNNAYGNAKNSNAYGNAKNSNAPTSMQNSNILTNMQNSNALISMQTSRALTNIDTYKQKLLNLYDSMQKKLENYNLESKKTKIEMCALKHEKEYESGKNVDKMFKEHKRTINGKTKQGLYTGKSLQFLVEEKNRLWIDLNKNEKNMKKSIEEYKKLENILLKSETSQFRVYQEIKDVAGVHGCVFEVLNVKEELFTALEACAGSKLFNVIVDNEEVVDEVMGKISGRITFLPLNRFTNDTDNKINNDTVDLIDGVETLKSKIKCKNIYKPLLNYITKDAFLVCDNEKGVKFSKQYNKNCVTFDGDFISKNGFLKGGYKKKIV